MGEPAIPPEVKAQSTDRLLTLFAQLTHKIHSAQMVQSGLVRDGDPAVAMAGEVDLRAQRAIVKNEILRRCGEV